MGKVEKVEKVEKTETTGSATICMYNRDCGRQMMIESIPCIFCTKYFGGCSFQKLGKITISWLESYSKKYQQELNRN